MATLPSDLFDPLIIPTSKLLKSIINNEDLRAEFVWNIVVGRALNTDLKKYNIECGRLTDRMILMDRYLKRVGLKDFVDEMNSQDMIKTRVEENIFKHSETTENILDHYTDIMERTKYLNTKLNKLKKQQKNKRKKANQKARRSIPDPPMDTPVPPAPYMCYPTNDPIEVCLDPTE